MSLKSLAILTALVFGATVIAPVAVPSFTTEAAAQAKKTKKKVAKKAVKKKGSKKAKKVAAAKKKDRPGKCGTMKFYNKKTKKCASKG